MTVAEIGEPATEEVGNIYPMGYSVDVTISPPERSPPMIHVNERFCPQNHACPAIASCPEGAIVQDDISSVPRIDRDLCTECGVCTNVCRVFSMVRDEVPVG